MVAASSRPPEGASALADQQLTPGKPEIIEEFSSRRKAPISLWMAKRNRNPNEAKRAERAVRARTAGWSVRRIATEEGIPAPEVNRILDDWVAGVVGQKLREREYCLLLERNDELIEALRPRALQARSRGIIREYSAALSRRATLLALRPPKETHVRILTDEAQRTTSFDRLNSAVQALIEQRPKRVDG